MGRPREHDESTRAALLAAAEDLLAAGGTEAVSVRAAADAVGTTTRAVYSVFGGKDGLLSALHQEAFRTLLRSLEAVPRTRDPGADLVAIGVQGFRRFALEHPNLFRLAFERLVPGLRRSEEDQAVALEALRELVRAVERCIDAGIIVDRAARDVAVGWHGACQGLASTELQGWLSRDGDPVGLWEGTLEALLRGLGTPPAPKPRARRRKGR